ncbi:alpha-N-acetylgalactosaminide alpha-2,6-sialyltransferase 6-like [Limulus polyphemus]|uniref:Alpha-N-acetylgalactosaminide alpha-2,6-sialyltransferase 6-like n=1 Tax=Limulus polyphemus TaxID=6850 RepID=A0ABM1TA81_LIMPO|nr:alpha-N-acetylgalactosaminide alpha-2,6-sialyltransferase 6-like [Limulus polyphemus]
MISKHFLKIRLFMILLSLGFVIHVILGLYTIIQSERRFRIKPRQVAVIDVRGHTYHRHVGEVVDMKLRKEYLKRRRGVESFQPHLMARREILGYHGHQYLNNKQTGYRGISGEPEIVPSTCQTCVLIGTSGTIIGSNRGAQIDAADCVFRLGLSPVTSFTNDVGSKTTFRILDAKNFQEITKKPQKFVHGALASGHVFVFDLPNVAEIVSFPRSLKKLTKQYRSIVFYRVDRQGEQRSLVSMREAAARAGYKLLGARPSTLWFTIQVMMDAGCSNSTIFGVPDPKYCK